MLIVDDGYVTAECKVQRGTLIMALDLAADVAVKPTSHVANWRGEHPCHHDGSRIRAFEHPATAQSLGDGIHADHTFSAKADYRDYHHKVTTYVGRIAGEAAKVETGVTAQTFPVLLAEDEDAVFKYVDTASSRAGIGVANDKIASQRIGVIGLGGTGTYVLDLVAKTAVREIHLFDEDVFSQHNAFTAPGAASVDQLAARSSKVAHFAQVYSAMRHGVVPHDTRMGESNAEQLNGLDFVFLCIDGGPAKREIVDALVRFGIPFVDTGMGLLLGDGDCVGGIVRVITSRPDTRHAATPHISFADAGRIGGEYSSNIQVAELNALNAALAVVSWKKVFGF